VRPTARNKAEIVDGGSYWVPAAWTRVGVFRDLVLEPADDRVGADWSLVLLKTLWAEELEAVGVLKVDVLGEVVGASFPYLAL